MEAVLMALPDSPSDCSPDERTLLVFTLTNKFIYPVAADAFAEIRTASSGFLLG